MADWAERIDALLRKAEGTDNEHEADAFQAKAEELIVKYGIDRAVLEAKRLAGDKNQKPEEIIKVSIFFKGAYAAGLVIMGAEICRGLGNLQTYTLKMGKNLGGSKNEGLVIMGFESDVKQAEVLVNSLALQCVTAMQRWWTSYILSGSFLHEIPQVRYSPHFKEDQPHLGLTGSEKFRMRREFIVSFGTGAKHRLITVRDVNVKNSEPGVGIVLRDRNQAIMDEFDKLKLSKTRPLRGGGDAARGAGTHAGRNANTGGTSMGGSRKALG